MTNNIASELMGLTPATRRMLLQVNTANDDPLSLTRHFVSSLNRQGRLVTVVTAEAHWLVSGEQATISGATQTAYNGTWTVTVVNATTFTYDLPGQPGGAEPATPATGTIISDGHIWFRTATFYGRGAVRTNNTGTVWIGPSAADNTQWIDINAGGEVVITCAVGCRENLKDYYLDPALAATEGVVVSFH